MKHILVALLIFSSIRLAFGQAVDSQQISGVVTDASGAAVAQAEITVTNEATRVNHSVRSNSDGNYIVLNLPVGTYTITTTSAEIGGSTEATQIQLNGRNYVQLLTLQPGVSQTVASGFAIFGTYGVNGNSQSVNGIRTDSANYFIDGVDNKDNGGGGNNFVNISPDSRNFVTLRQATMQATEEHPGQQFRSQSRAADTIFMATHMSTSGTMPYRDTLFVLLAH